MIHYTVTINFPDGTETEIMISATGLGALETHLNLHYPTATSFVIVYCR